jgi:hypothetical protein
MVYKYGNVARIMTRQDKTSFKQISVNITSEELASLNKIAAMEGVSLSSFVRESIQKSIALSRKNGDDKIRELAMIQSIISGTVKAMIPALIEVAAETGGADPSDEDIKEMIKRITAKLIIKETGNE